MYFDYISAKERMIQLKIKKTGGWHHILGILKKSKKINKDINLLKKKNYPEIQQSQS